MSTTAIIALGSGLVGALFSAYLSYIVRLKAKEREDADERKRLAHVNFLLLTDAVAADSFVTNVANGLVGVYGLKTEDYELSHIAATYLASKFSELGQEDLISVRFLLKPVVRAAMASTETFEINQSDLGRMHEITIYAYHRFQTMSARLRAAFDLLDSVLEQHDTKLLDAPVIHSIIRAYRDYADAAGILRAGLQNSAGLSSDYSVQCMKRSYDAVRADSLASLSHNAKLKAAKDAAEAAQSPETQTEGIAASGEHVSRPPI